MKKIVLLAVAIALCACAPFTLALRSRAAGMVPGEIVVGGQTRTYRLYVPASVSPDKPAPLVLAFHGGGAQGASMEGLAHFNELADREGFLVAYPDGLYREWNDGRDRPFLRRLRGEIDDVAFVNALLDTIDRQYSLDAARIFATGISNGGIFSHYLGAKLSTRIAAIAPVAGGIGEPFVEQGFQPEQPVSVLMINGTADPLVPYYGGGVVQGVDGNIVDTDRAVQMWVQTDGAQSTAQIGTLPDTDPADGCTVRWSTWSGGRNGTEVTLYTVEGGGHTWAGRAAVPAARYHRLGGSRFRRDQYHLAILQPAS
jgi:polyhydroxybutyrate depolymerase